MTTVRRPDPHALYAWLIRTPEGYAPILSHPEHAAQFVFLGFDKALAARDTALAIAERTGWPLDMVELRPSPALLTIDPAEWQDDDPHVPLGQPPAPAEEPRS